MTHSRTTKANNYKALVKSFNAMNNIFTSYEFYNECLLNGYVPTKSKGAKAEFLQKFATNQKRYSKTWIKNTSKNIEKLKVEKPKLEENNLNEQQMISYLKSKGYRILNPGS